MSHTETTKNMAAARLEALLAEDRPTAENTCCAGCRRGTKELGQFPCGRAGRCDCHERTTA